MAEIVVPGTALEEASAALSEMLTFVDSDRIPGDILTAFGSDAIGEAARDFDGRWGDGRFQLKRQGEDIRESIEQIRSGFQKIDDDAAASLEAK
ncbi:hypothetical protein J2S43_001220 [Catenuloplanes nepalensis]|uniref:Uncharacterized protein n=1 Tax=Catenuloplanes nepalensis TaxID=587533 RepID=A0ABT9MN36_9ACTN|nr:hypothetical protein [Catenuloplanes nepalensis]MDP9792708.1 hypothetical protein [Catenuloplanes nepalensis]